MSVKDKEQIELIEKVLFTEEIGGLPADTGFWPALLKVASRNRVLYYFAVELKKSCGQKLPSDLSEKIADIIARGQAWQQRLAKTLLFTKERFSSTKIPFLVVKTRRDIPYVTYDVDILVRPQDYPRVGQLLRDRGRLGRHPGKQSRNQMNFFGEELLAIDIHKDFSWQGFNYLDKDVAWSGRSEALISGVGVPIPCAEVEFLLYAAHIIYERRHITILDLNNMVSLSRQIKNPGLISEQIKKFGWEKSFTGLLSLMNALTRRISPFFKEEFTFLPLPKFEIKGRWGMPYFISPFMVAGFFHEKSVFEKKIPFWDIAYYIFATGRYYLGGKRQFPYYLEWYHVK